MTDVEARRYRKGTPHLYLQLRLDRLGFYIAIGDYSREQVLALCKQVSKQTAFNIWKREGPVGENKNRTFQPALAEQTGYDDSVRKACVDECAGSKRTFPEEFRKLRPALKGRWFIDFPEL
ncbi:MAG: hypothetical protein LGR52_08165 [Candidatus Thiosymbion ectosymbiont of Robbea hypermnestra]|nr:hypothetical protein [Candidatus Thiosymbion ectosymbiont of Robbea hypermnestra]